MARNDTEWLLQVLNDKMALSMMPVVIYLSILLIVGFVGNGMVVYYYGCKTRRNSNSVFICTVAVYDLLSCSLSIPIEIVDLRFFYMFTNSGACKVLRFVNHTAAIGSAFTLLIIASDRFWRICRPFRSQLSLGQSKRFCLVTIVVAVVLSSPAFVFYQSVTTDLVNEDGIGLQGCDCTTTKEESYKPYYHAFLGIYLVLFVISTIVLCTLYSIIGRVIYRHSQFRKRYSKRDSIVGSPSTASLKQARNGPTVNKKTFVDPDAVKDAEGSKNSEVRNNIRNNVFSMKIKNSVDISKGEKSQPEQLDIKTVKYTIIMLVITMVFVISFLPYLCLIAWKTFYSGFWPYDSSVAFQIGIRSYFLNSALNPVTYGFFNSKFRKFFSVRLCPCFKDNISTRPPTSSSVG